MFTSETALRAVTSFALVGMISLGTSGAAAAAKAASPPGLFSEFAGASKIKLPQQAIAGKSRAVKINRGQLRSGRFTVTLPDGESYEAVRDFHQDKEGGQSVWVGHARNSPGNTIVLSASGTAVAGTFTYNGRMFKLEPRANGSHVLSEVDSNDPAPELDSIPVADAISTGADSNASAGTSADGSASIIDVLVAYTPAIAALYGTQGAQALILQSVAEANQAYTNSTMSTRLNLVGSVLTNYTESGDMNSDLSRLRGTNDGYMDELHTLRNNFAADIVSLIADAPQYCGLAYRMATLSSSFATSAFSVVNHSCATGYYSFAHEIGHNQGAHHDVANATGAIYSYAYGYQDPFNRFRSVMAYDCYGGCPRIALFSSGDNPIYGIPTGDANTASNALAIDQTASTVAAFRQVAAQLQPPTAPSDLYSSDTSPSSLRLHWTDRSTDESGFVLERSMDGINFTQIAALPANTATYLDSNLQASRSYSYRARAWNSTAYSGYSNVATATTDAAAPALPPGPAPFEVVANGYKVSGLHKVDMAWSGSTSQAVDIYRNGAKLRSAIANTGSFVDNINRKGKGSYTYKVCEAGKNTCSNTVAVNF